MGCGNGGRGIAGGKHAWHLVDGRRARDVCRMCGVGTVTVTVTVHDSGDKVAATKIAGADLDEDEDDAWQP